MRYSQTNHTGYDPTTRTTIVQSRRYSATSWGVPVVLETSIILLGPRWHDIIPQSLSKNLFFFFSHFQNSLTWSLSEHFTMFSGRSQACSIESADLDEVMSVWQHVLQPGLVDRCGDKYAVCSRFWMVILRPVLNLEDSEGKIVNLRAVTMW